MVLVSGRPFAGAPLFFAMYNSARGRFSNGLERNPISASRRDGALAHYRRMNTAWRLGKFRIDREVIDRVVRESRDEDVARWAAVFGQVLVIEAVHRYDLRSTEYLAYSHHFEDVPVGMDAPLYDVEINRREEILAGQPVVTFDPKFIKRAS